MRKIIHVSDIHFGRADRESLEKLVDTFIELKPDMAIISGDITQRATVQEFEEGKRFLRKLKKNRIPYFVIPGNHDISPLYKPFSRIFKPYDRFSKYISPTIDPVFKDGEIAIASINTVRSSKLLSGRVNDEHIEKVGSWLHTMSDGIVKIIVTHHPFVVPGKFHTWRTVKKSPDAIYKLAQNKVDLYLSGHYHRSSILHTTDQHRLEHYSAIAVQAGTVSLRKRKKEPQSFHVLKVDKPKIDIDTYVWDKEALTFKPSSCKKFSLRKEGWRKKEGFPENVSLDA